MCGKGGGRKGRGKGKIKGRSENVMGDQHELGSKVWKNGTGRKGAKEEVEKKTVRKT